MPKHPSLLKRRKTTFSVGLIVIDSKKKVYLIERHLPYKVEDYIFKNNKNKLQLYRQNLSKSILLANKLQMYNYDVDIDRFLSSTIFEDKYDFPRGQCQELTRTVFNNHEIPLTQIIEKYISTNLDTLLQRAWKEWFEETGLYITNWRFSSYFRYLKNVKAFLINFTGGDGFEYTQLFFVTFLYPNQNIRKRNVVPEYKVQVLDLREASKIFYVQDKLVSKSSFKNNVLDLMLNNYTEKCSYIRLLHRKKVL